MDNKIDTDNGWIVKLRDDLIRINITIDEVRKEVWQGIDRLKILETERKNILDNFLNED